MVETFNFRKKILLIFKHHLTFVDSIITTFPLKLFQLKSKHLNLKMNFIFITDSKNQVYVSFKFIFCCKNCIYLGTLLETKL